MFLFVIALSALAMFSCKKEKLNDYEKCFQIPSSKSISSGELLGDTVFIEWRVNDGANGKFTSIISQSKLSSNGVPELVINGTFVSETGVVFTDKTQPLIVLVLNETKTEIFSVKTFFSTEGSAWNSMNSAEMGVIENNSIITVVLNNMESSNNNELSMCLKLEIKE